MRIVETTSASERAAAARRAELAGRHARLASLCELLEEIADDLPRAYPSRCHRAATALQTLLPEHHAFTRELFSRLLSETQPDVLENIVRQQGEEEGLALEIVQALGAWPDGAGVPDPETLGYMLRCFFNGCRRSMLVEELALRSAEPAGDRTAGRGFRAAPVRVTPLVPSGEAARILWSRRQNDYPHARPSPDFGQCSDAALRYTLRARNSAGTVDFMDKLTIDAALRKAAELRDAEFQQVTLINIESGVEITDLEQFMRER